MINFQVAVDKMCSILESNHDLSKRFYLKWGVESTNFRKKITDPLTHGGYISKMISLNNLKLSKTNKVLDIGPEMGLEVFMLSEFAENITVCDPDQSNLDLIKMIASHYVNDRGQSINEVAEFRALGFNNDESFSVEEKNRYESIVKKIGHSLPAFYEVTSVEPLSSLKDKFDLVFIHKILTTITRSGKKDSFEVFKNALEDVRKLIGSRGICSWTEPEFVWEQKDIMNNISKIDGVKVRFVEYVPDGLPEKFVQLITTAS